MASEITANEFYAVSILHGMSEEKTSDGETSCPACNVDFARHSNSEVIACARKLVTGAD